MIEVKNVSKSIKGKLILENINVSLDSYKIYGIYGENGSGKTMLLRMLAGLIIPDEGTVSYEGKVLNRDIDFPKDLGVIIEHMELLNHLDAYQNLKLLSKYRKAADQNDIEEAIRRVGLADYRGLKVKKYSLGMKQRLNLAQAIFEHQRYLLLDEPFNALDEKGREQLENILFEEKQKGATIIITHHYMDELKRVADIIYKMENAKLVILD